jgi:hypothetical protein
LNIYKRSKKVLTFLPKTSKTADMKKKGKYSVKSSQVNTLPKAKSKTRSKQNNDMHNFSSVYSERGVPLPLLTSGGE